MKKTWETANGDYIEYTKLEDSHLLNIIKFIERKAEEGLTIQYGGGTDAEDIWYDEDELSGEEVLQHFDYAGLKQEATKRNLKP